MMHSFDTEHAERYGVIAAIILQNILWWIEKNKANEKHFHDGRYWTYNSVRAMLKLFPYLTPKQIRKALDLLREESVILTGNYSENKSDRSLWYALVDETLLPLRAIGHSPRKAKGVAQEGKSSIDTDNKPDISVADAPKKHKTLEERRAEFKAAIKPHVEEFGRDLCNEFYAYWAEASQDGRKMKFEYERTWEVYKRLSRWKKNDDEKKAKAMKMGKPFNDTPLVASDPRRYHEPLTP